MSKQSFANPPDGAATLLESVGASGDEAATVSGSRGNESSLSLLLVEPYRADAAFLAARDLLRSGASERAWENGAGFPIS